MFTYSESKTAKTPTEVEATIVAEANKNLNSRGGLGKKKIKRITQCNKTMKVHEEKKDKRHKEYQKKNRQISTNKKRFIKIEEEKLQSQYNYYGV